METGRDLITALTIAGSDSSGGAGIQASLRTFAAMGVFGVSTVTAVTAQSSGGVSGVWPLAAEKIAAQLEAVLSDFIPGAVQIGMLGTAAAVEVVAELLSRSRPPHVVLDPVLAASSGALLLDVPGRKRVVERLLPLAEIVTPNLPEAADFSGIRIADEAGMEAAARWFLENGARAVLVKGGHKAGPPRDLLARANEPSLWIEGERDQAFRRSGVPALEVSEGSGVHGTGCVLAAAIVARLARGRNLVGAVVDAKRFVEAAIRNAVAPGSGRHCAEPMAGTGLFSPESGELHAARLARLRGVYVVTDSTLCRDRDARRVAAAAVAGGACAVQLREKSLSTPALVSLARELALQSAAGGTLFLVNDRVDVALASGADGAHVGPDDMPPADARLLLGPDRLLGVSVGTVKEARAAAPYASYFGVGAIYGSRTKADAGAAVTPARIAEIRAAVTGIPIVAIGGIDAGNISEVSAAGADAAGVVSAVVTAPDMVAAVRELSGRFWAAMETTCR